MQDETQEPDPGPCIYWSYLPRVPVTLPLPPALEVSRRVLDKFGGWGWRGYWALEAYPEPYCSQRRRVRVPLNREHIVTSRGDESHTSDGLGFEVTVDGT